MPAVRASAARGSQLRAVTGALPPENRLRRGRRRAGVAARRGETQAVPDGAAALRDAVVQAGVLLDGRQQCSQRELLRLPPRSSRRRSGGNLALAVLGRRSVCRLLPRRGGKRCVRVVRVRTAARGKKESASPQAAAAGRSRVLLSRQKQAAVLQMQRRLRAGGAGGLTAAPLVRAAAAAAAAAPASGGQRGRLACAAASRLAEKSGRARLDVTTSTSAISTSGTAGSAEVASEAASPTAGSSLPPNQWTSEANEEEEEKEDSAGRALPPEEEKRDGFVSGPAASTSSAARRDCPASDPRLRPPPPLFLVSKLPQDWLRGNDDALGGRPPRGRHGIVSAAAARPWAGSALACAARMGWTSGGACRVERAWRACRTKHRPRVLQVGWRACGGRAQGRRLARSLGRRQPAPG